MTRGYDGLSAASRHTGCSGGSAKEPRRSSWPVRRGRPPRGSIGEESQWLGRMSVVRRIRTAVRFAVSFEPPYDPRMTHLEETHESRPPRRRPRLRRGLRRVFLVVFLTFIAWLLLANHLIVVTGAPAVIVLKKTSWTFDGSVIGVGSWASFTLHHPILTSRIALGQGLWLLGSAP